MHFYLVQILNGLSHELHTISVVLNCSFKCKVLRVRSITRNELSHIHFLGNTVLQKVPLNTKLSPSFRIKNLLLIDLASKLQCSHTN